MRIVATAVSLCLVLAGCSTGSNDSPSTPVATQPSSTEISPETPGSEALAPTPEDEVRVAAEGLSAALEANDATGAWGYYSQRCKALMGDSVEQYRAMMDIQYSDRNPQVESHTVRVNGSSAQVVTVDPDPAAPADSMNPRTWTFIDDRWQFDNC